MGQYHRQRRLLAKDIDHERLQHWTDRRVCAHIGCPLKCCDCRSLLCHAPPSLWAILGVEQEWLRTLHGDLQWWTQLTQTRTSRPTCNEDPGFWHELARHHPGTWHGLVKKAKHQLVLQLPIDHEVDLWHLAFIEVLEDAGVSFPSSHQHVPHDALPHACLKCKRLFARKASWVHSFRCHHRVAPSRYRAVGATCDVCGRNYHNNERLANHLRNICYEELTRRTRTQQPGMEAG